MEILVLVFRVLRDHENPCSAETRSHIQRPSYDGKAHYIKEKECIDEDDNIMSKAKVEQF